MSQQAMFRSTSAMDWPLSREEKKSQLLRLYNDDVMAADSMVESGNKALEALREELDAVRKASGVFQKPKKAENSDPSGYTTPRSTENEVERLRQAVESAAAVLRAIVPAQDDDEPVAHSTPQKMRARSEGAERDCGAVALRPALCRTPRQAGRPKRKVSFGGQPEEEPAYDPEACKDMDLKKGCPIVKLKMPPTRKDRSRLAPSSPPAAKSPISRSSPSSPKAGSSLKVHLTWLLCSLGLVTLCGYGAFQLGSSRAPTTSLSTIGDPQCWKFGFKPEFCCNANYGPTGVDECWNQEFTYHRCCRGFADSEL